MKNTHLPEQVHCKDVFLDMTLSGSCKCQLDGAGNAVRAAPVWLLSGCRHNYWQAEFIGVSSVSTNRRLNRCSTALGDFWLHIISKGGGYHRKQEQNLHIIIMSACKDGLLNYIPFQTFNGEEMRSTHFRRSINFNCKSFPKQDWRH